MATKQDSLAARRAQARAAARRAAKRASGAKTPMSASKRDAIMRARIAKMNQTKKRSVTTAKLRRIAQEAAQEAVEQFVEEQNAGDVDFSGPEETELDTPVAPVNENELEAAEALEGPEEDEEKEDAIEVEIAVEAARRKHTAALKLARARVNAGILPKNASVSAFARRYASTMTYAQIRTATQKVATAKSQPARTAPRRASQVRSQKRARLNGAANKTHRSAEDLFL